MSRGAGTRGGGVTCLGAGLGLGAPYSKVQCIMGNGHMGTPLWTDWLTYWHIWKHYLPTTLLTGSKIKQNQQLDNTQNFTLNYFLEPKRLESQWSSNKNCILPQKVAWFFIFFCKICNYQSHPNLMWKNSNVVQITLF